MRNEALDLLDGLVGDWRLTLANAWFIDDPDFKGEGQATINWLGDAFIEIATADAGRINGRWEASEDFGRTWRKDFDLIFERR